jgi:fumarate hydratase subunit beta
MISLGQRAMIGKGNRSDEVVDAMKKHGAVYFAAVGGAGALYSGCVQSCGVIGFEDLGCESVKKLVIKDFPLLVAIDSLGNSLYNK